MYSGAETCDINFAYEKEKILKDFSVSIPKTGIIGIIGKSGSGKSTFLKLLMRFWDVDSGKIEVSDQLIKVINTSSLRNAESYVTQETVLFHDSIERNLLFANPNAAHKQVMEACKKASIHEFIETMPDGYNTSVGELGETLSGGEKQRLGLARAFLYNAPLILLDEPTSSLDSLNEEVILKSLKEFCKKKAVVLVSHRKSTMCITDKVISVENVRVS